MVQDLLINFCVSRINAQETGREAKNWNKRIYFIIHFFKCTLKDTWHSWAAKKMAFHYEHPKWYQNPWFTSLSETE